MALRAQVAVLHAKPETVLEDYQREGGLAGAGYGLGEQWVVVEMIKNERFRSRL